MARATKQKRNTDSSKFKGAVDASAEKDRGKSGVEHDEQGPVYLEPLSEGERAAAGEKLADKLADLAELEQDYRDTAAKFRKDIKLRKQAITKLRDEVREGVRKTSAQKALPGTEAAT